MLLLALLACHHRHDVEDRGHFWVSWDEDHTTLSLGRDDDTLLAFPADALELGVVSAIDDDASFDPYYPDSAVHWRDVQGATVDEGADADVAVDLTYEDAAATLTVTEGGEGRFTARLVPTSGTVAYVRLRPRISSTEGLYGLGETFDSVQQRGKVRPMQMELDPTIESSDTETHVPVPLLVGTNGWGLFVEDRHPGLFEVATDADDVVQTTWGTGVDSADGLTFHLYAADYAIDVTGRYYADAGYPRLPARWALGPWIWRDETPGQTDVEADLAAIRDLDLATTGYWIDRPYASGVNTFDFDPARYPDPQAMIDDAHDLGFRLAVWHVPYLDPGEAADLYAEAEVAGYYPPVPGTSFNSWGKPIDFTNPDALAWWQGLVRRYTDLGIEGFKLDYAEDVVVGANGARTHWTFADGEDERTAHATYPLLYHRTYAETLPADGGFLLCRAGAWGDQVNGPIVWPGDIDADLVDWEQDVDADGGYVAVGGLSSAISASIGLGVSGFPFFGSDTGGYRHSPPDKETFVRWFEHTALSTVMQQGTSSNDVAWEPTAENGFDDDVLTWYRDFARLHLRLFAYEWTYAERLSVDGRAIERPLGLVHPELGADLFEDGGAGDDVYLFGDSLLVAPVSQRGATTRDVPFPDGRWVDWFTGDVVEGGGVETVDAPLGKLPLYLAEGGIVPLLRPTIDAIAATGQPDRVDSLATDAGVLWPRVFAGPDETSFTVYDGATVTAQDDGQDVVLGWSDGAEYDQGAVFEVLGLDGATSVRLDGEDVPQVDPADVADGGWAWDGRSLWVRVPSGTHSVQVER